jgi:hypothetical protein
MSDWLVFGTGLALGLAIGSSAGILISALMCMARGDE